MGQYILYYVKKYWYVIVLLLVLLLVGAVWFMNRDTTPSAGYEDYNNKVEFEPPQFTEAPIEPSDSLGDLEVGVPYIGTTAPYVPTNIVDPSEKEEFIKEFEKDPNYVYKKKISWAEGELSKEQLLELVELVGYHLNKTESKTVNIVSLPSPEQLAEYNQEVVYYTSDGTLSLNLYVEEINQDAGKKKSYCYMYKLKYDMHGRIIIT